MRRIMMIALTMSVAAAWSTAADDLGLVPEPVQVEQVEGRIELAGARVTALGDAPTVEYAREVLAKALPAGDGDALPVVVQLADGAEQLRRLAGVLGLQAPDADRWRDAFVVDCGVHDADRVRIVGGPRGVIYGAYAVADLLQADGDRLSIPRAQIVDWPSLTERGRTGIMRDVSEASLEMLDWWARWRVNAGYYEIYGDRGQDSVPEEVTDIARECRRRGITLYGLISNWRTDLLLGRPMCPSNPDDLARVRRYATELLDHGCEGLIFLFDDIRAGSIDHPTECELCSQRFDGLAEVQLELMRPMIEVARERRVQQMIVCPTPYWRRWRDRYGERLDGERYFRTWGNAELLDGVGIYHCLVRPGELAELREAGLRNYVYWYNGVYHYERLSPGRDLPHNLWGGLPEPHFGWYLTTWDDERGIVPDDDAISALRRLPTQTRRAWLCGGGTDKIALWGTYCWRPEALDPAELSRSIVRCLYGDATWEPYRRWRDLVRSWLPRLLHPPAVITDEQREALNVRLLADAAAALDAAQEFADITHAAEAEADPEHRASVASRMHDSATMLRELATRTAPQVEMEPLSTRQSGEATRYERKITLGTAWRRFLLRHAQEEEPDGSLHRVQYHFGSGLGMLAPSHRNWYDAGFIDVVLDGHSLSEYRPQFAEVPVDDGEQLEATWETQAGTVRLRMTMFADGGLRIDGAIEGAEQAAPTVKLFAIPSAGEGGWEDMDRYVVTASGRTPHGEPVTLGPGERWIFFADATYDVPHEHAEGPCAVLFGSDAPEATTDNARYVVTTDAAYPAGTGRFRLVVWDLHGMRNAQGLERFRSRLEDYRDALAEDPPGL